MVIITGIIRDGKKDVDTLGHYINGASITYGSVTTSSVDGVFQISSNVVESTILSITKERYITVPINMVSFGVKYDPNILLSGTVLDATSVSGDTSVTTLSMAGMELISGAYTSSMISVVGGLNSGQICYVISNTEKSFNVKF
jgi:precorrin isomerase